MLIEIRNAKVLDPLHPRNGQIASLFVRDERFVDPPREKAEHIIDLGGALTLAGGIDIHTHIGGGKVNLARLLMPAGYGGRSNRDGPVWPTGRTGELYARMGYTTCFEPAMLLSGARHTHLELADTPHLDSGAYVVLGNEPWLMRALGQSIEDAALDALVAWSVRASRAMAVKVVNAGGIAEFQFNKRDLAVDERHSQFGVTPREVIRRLSGSVQRLGLAHPLHVHASNLGVPGNIAATLATLDAAEGQPIHLTHAQFNCYSTEGPFGMGSAAERLARYVSEHQNVTLDVGQIVFGQTITLSADIAAQFRNRHYADPNRWIINSVECQAGCGLVPFRYEDRQYVHSLQWTIGLELMLLVNDPWRVFLTTDHPNGGPFTSYPHLIRLLMDRSFRQSQLERIHPRAAEKSLLQELTREYSLDEIAIVTRAAPARILGLGDRGSLNVGAVADLAAYTIKSDWQTTFSEAQCVLKRGRQIVRDGLVVEEGLPSRCQSLSARIEQDYDWVRGRMAEEIEATLQMPLSSIEVSDWEFEALIGRPLVQSDAAQPFGKVAVDGHAN